MQNFILIYITYYYTVTIFTIKKDYLRLSSYARFKPCILLSRYPRFNFTTSNVLYYNEDYYPKLIPEGTEIETPENCVSKIESVQVVFNDLKSKSKFKTSELKTFYTISSNEEFQHFINGNFESVESQEIIELTDGLKLIDTKLLSPDYNFMASMYRNSIKEWYETEQVFRMTVQPTDEGKIYIDLPPLLNISNIKNLYKSIQNLINNINSLEKKGFLNVIDLRDKEFNFIQTYLNSLLNYKYPGSDETKEGQKISKNWDISPGKSTIESYKWTFNFLMLNLYYLTLEGLQSLEQIEDLTDESISDFQSDLINLNRDLYGKIDPSIRNKIQKRGITIFQNIYTGFDTEYQNKDTKTNRLLSVQLAVNTHTFIKIPWPSVYSIGSIGTLNQVEYKKKHQTYKGPYNYNKVENSLNNLINLVRNVRFNKHDQSIKLLIEGLIKKGYKHFEKDNCFFFSIPLTSIEKFIYYNNKGKGYSFKDMVNQSNVMGEPQLSQSYDLIISELIDIFSSGPSKYQENNLNVAWDVEGLENFTMPSYKDNMIVESDSSLNSNDSEFELKSDLESESEFSSPTNKLIKYKPAMKKMSRQYMTNFTSDKISVTKYKTNYFIGHLTNADLSMLSDFDSFKENLDIVNKSFITLGKSFQYQNSNIQIRDTMLLAPSGSKSLSAISRLYGEAFHKIQLTKEEISNMDQLLRDNKEKFQEYALRDAEITLIHALWTEHFHFSIKSIGIPITLSSLGSKFVKNNWEEINYAGYQIHPKILIGDANTVQTPIGLLHSSEIGLKLSLYISNYKGGRNESFMYGVDKDTYWFDYDLISAYTTILSNAGHPLYENGSSLTDKKLKELKIEELLFSYTIIKGTFKFPKTVKFPSIPCHINESTTVYPLEGSCILTGAEYLLAKNQGCEITVQECYRVPFSKTIKPFEQIIHKIQKLRRDYKKGTISNLFYKEMGNSIYGNIVKGMNDKRKFDIKSNRTIRMDASSLSNPLIASWTTAFIRSIIGECLQGISVLQPAGKVVSVTTDGFITDVPNLEDELIANSKSNSNLLGFYKRMRDELSEDNKALEVKTEGKGIISWTTRGQLGLESRIKATTGFQVKSLSNSELAVILIDKLSSENKFFEYIQFSLRSAKDIYLKGGHVTPVYRDQIFRIQFDNRRKILLEDAFKDEFDWSQRLLDSKPLKNVEECDTLRSLSKLHKTRVYNKKLNAISTQTIKSYEDIAIRNFIKVYYYNPIDYGLRGDEFSNYSAIIQFIHNFKPKFKISKSSISNLKSRKLIFKPTPRLKETISFVKYVKMKFPEFKDEIFFEN